MITVGSSGDLVRFKEGPLEGITFEITRTTIYEDNRIEYRIKSQNKTETVWVPADKVELLSDPNPTAQPTVEHGSCNCLSWKKGLPDQPDSKTLPPIVTLLMAIQYDKEKTYGSSWKGKGEYRGIMANIDRKYDRLDNITNAEIAGQMESLAELERKLEEAERTSSEPMTAELLDAIGESKVDAVADLTNYGLLYLGYIRENYPRVFRVWVDRNVPKYLAVKIPFLQNR